MNVSLLKEEMCLAKSNFLKSGLRLLKKYVGKPYSRRCNSVTLTVPLYVVIKLSGGGEKLRSNHQFISGC